MQLNMDLSHANPVQNEGIFATVPLPSAHLVVITEDEMKRSTDQTTGFDKGANLVLHCEILNSSCGNEYTGQKLGLYIPMEGQETAVSIGQRRLSTLAHTLGLGNFLTSSEQLHGQAFIVVLDKDSKGSNFPQWKKILRSDGMEISDASGNFKECTFKEVALQAELHKLLEINKVGQSQSAPAATAPQVGQPAAPQGFNNVPQQQAAAPSYVPQNGQAPAVVSQQPAPAAIPQNGFGNAAAPQFPNPNFGATAGQPQWNTTVNQSNGQ